MLRNLPFLLTRWILLCLFSTYALIAGATGEPRHALVIGNAAYANESPLENTLHDARDMAAKLEQFGFRVTKVESAGRMQMGRAVNDFLRRIRGGDAPALFYYSATGMQVGGQNYLIPVDAKIDDALDVPLAGLALNRMLSAMGDRGDEAVNLIVLDACRDNPFKQDGAKAIGDKGLARVAAPSGTLILYATRPGQTASDNPGGRNGLFTQHLLETMGQPGVQVEETFKRVAQSVFRESGRRQSPWLEGVIYGRFYFLPPEGGPLPPPPPPPQVQGYLQVIVDVDDAAVTVNGHSVGQASPRYPLNLSQGLPPGQVTVEVTADGYESARRVARIVPNQWTQSVFTLLAKPTAPAPAPTLPLTVKTSPEGARVRILNIKPKYRDGIALKPGRYHIEVAHPGYQKHLSWHELKPGGELYTVELAPEERPPAVLPSAPAPRLEPARRKDYEPELVTISGRCFQMGSPASETMRNEREHQHLVCVDDFKIGQYEVTQAQWRAIMGSNPSRFKGCDNCPVEMVSWNDVQAYLERLNTRTGKHYRLPTEAEWEYAARAGTTTPFSTGRCINTDQANYYDNYDYAERYMGTYRCTAKTGVYRRKTLPVGALRPNPWGLYDVHGNVCEWTCSAYDEGYGGGERRCVGQGHGGAVAVRGGAWPFTPWMVRSASRSPGLPGGFASHLGFRLAQD